jgi:hypothetical protein
MKMQFSIGKHISSACPKTGSSAGHKWRPRWLRWLFPLTGLVALIWFLVRVIPKPSRATYPCQRVAFPLAAGFVTWVIGVIGSMVAFRKAKHYLVRSRYVVGALCIAVGIGAALMAASGGNEHIALADNPIPNDPIGIARGIHPGRVVWVHDPNATDWDGPGMGDGYWWESGNTNMAVVDQMMSRAIRTLAGENDSTEAWDRIFRYFNQTHGKGDVGYWAGEKITIKINLVGCIGVTDWGGVDTDTYDLIDKMNYMNTSPQMMLALLRQLVYKVGVNQADIAIGDTLCYFPNQYYDMLYDEFPDVRYLDYEGKFGRTVVQQSSVPLYWSSHPSVSYQDYVPVSYAEADYIINMANFKSHSSAAVTFCGKNHYGSLVRWPAQSGYYDLHNDLPSNRDGMGHYRPLVDLMGHAHIGGKTLLYLIDGLYAGHHPHDDAPTKLNSAPFNGDWSSSLFVSQDPVAIDSVAFDFLWAEPGWDFDTHMAGGEDYLHEAAQVDNPPSGTFYDPDHSGDVTRLASLGVHEHWNNPKDKQYSRNLGTGDGIELIFLEPVSTAPIGVESLGTGRYETKGKGKAKTTTFVLTDTFNAGDEIVICAQVVDGLRQPVSKAVVDILLTGPETISLTTKHSDDYGVAVAYWKTSAPKKRGKKNTDPGTAPGTSRTTVVGVTAKRHEWDNVTTYYEFIID